MALSVVPYRIKVDYTYANTASATTVTSNINSALTGLGRPEQAVRNGANVFLQIDGLSEAEAVAIRNAINSAWSAAARSSGKAAMTRRAPE